MEDLKLQDLIASNILVHYDESDTMWIAHCLELDLVGSGDSALEAVLELLDVMCLQLKECLKDGTPYVQLAPKEYWERWQAAKPFSLLDQLQKQHPSLPGNIVIKEFSENVSQ